MSPSELQHTLVQTLHRIEDAHERLAFVQDRVRTRAALGGEFRTDAHRVSGCVTQVWLAPSFREERCWFEVDSESQMVRGLAALVVDCFSGALPQEILSFQCSVLEAAGLEKRITPTRLHGLANLEVAIKRFAQSRL